MSDTVQEKLFGMEPEKGRWLLVALGMIINLCLRLDLFVERLCQATHRLFYRHIGSAGYSE